MTLYKLYAIIYLVKLCTFWVGKIPEGIGLIGNLKVTVMCMCTANITRAYINIRCVDVVMLAGGEIRNLLQRDATIII